MLAMSKLDTYKSIEHYAKNPNSSESIISFRLLQRRAELDISCKAYSLAPTAEDIDTITKIYLGVKDLGERKASSDKEADMQNLTADALAHLPRVQQLDIYTKLCASAGYDIDPSTLLDKRGEDATRSK